jgi:hypothetical protein
MGFLNRFIRQEVEGVTPEQMQYEADVAAMQEEARQMQRGGYSGGQPLGPMSPMSLPPNVDHETMKIYLKPETPKKKDELKGEDRYWLLSDSVCTAILSGNLDKSSQTRMEIIMRQARDLQGCDHVSNLIMNLQYEAYMIVITNKARSDLPDHIRERLAQGVGMSFYGDANSMVKSTGERPKESRAIFGLMGAKGGQH